MNFIEILLKAVVSIGFVKGVLFVMGIISVLVLYCCVVVGQRADKAIRQMH